MAKLSNIQFFINTDSYILLVVYNDSETEVIDITTWAISFMVKSYPQDADGSAVITKTTSSGITINGTFNVNPSTNTQQATVTIADTDTSSLAPGTYYWEMKRTDNGNETVLAYGKLELLASVHAG